MSVGFSVYLKSSQDFDSVLIAIYIFGFVSLSGLFVVFPGGSKVMDEWGAKIKIGNINNLSKLQVFILLSWFIGFGAALIYLNEFKNAL